MPKAGDMGARKICVKESMQLYPYPVILLFHFWKGSYLVAVNSQMLCKCPIYKGFRVSTHETKHFRPRNKKDAVLQMKNVYSSTSGIFARMLRNPVFTKLSGVPGAEFLKKSYHRCVAS